MVMKLAMKINLNQRKQIKNQSNACTVKVAGLDLDALITTLKKTKNSGETIRKSKEAVNQKIKRMILAINTNLQKKAQEGIEEEEMEAIVESPQEVKEMIEETTEKAKKEETKEEVVI